MMSGFEALPEQDVSLHVGAVWLRAGGQQKHGKGRREGALKG